MRTSKLTIQRIDIPQTVRVRKYEVDCQALCDLLRERKSATGKSNRELSEALGVPITKVEHWFRQDGCFSIPGEDVWEDLKEQLAIATDEFDESIMTFEERFGVYEKSERCYFAEGIAPTLTSTSAGNEKIIVEENDMQSNETCVAAAVRGHYTEDWKTEQQIEVSGWEYANTITSVQKDSLIATQPINTESDGTARTIKSQYYKNGIANLTNDNTKGGKYACTGVTDGMRIRKLTPKECFRLMGFDDADHDKAAAVNSNSQLYKQAGNSIGVPVVEHIIANLLPFLRSDTE